MKNKHLLQKATLAAGCFWHVEEVFKHVKGVISTTVGYTGGKLESPTYEDVCTDKTEHAEAIEIEYDPSTRSYKEMLEVFWNCHDPTQINKQGPDIGTQYRSAIFYHNEEQKKEAIARAKKVEIHIENLNNAVFNSASAESGTTSLNRYEDVVQ